MVPPLLLASLLFDQPSVPVRARGAVAELAAEERAVVGGQAPPSPSALGYRARRAFAAAQGFFVQPRGLDLLAPAWRHRPREGRRFCPLSRADVAAPPRAGARHCARRHLLPRSEEHTSELQSLRHLVC